MSYDIRLGVKIADSDLFAVIAEPELSSPTYNIGEMFRICTGWDFEQSEWYKVTDVLPLIEHGIHELKFNEYEYKQYNSPNGWGNTRTALVSLESMLKCIYDTATGDWGQNQIPIEYLWVKW